MSQSILIESNNYNGQDANVLFYPDTTDIVINLGVITIPFLFEPSMLYPPQEPLVTIQFYRLIPQIVLMFYTYQDNYATSNHNIRCYRYIAI